MLLSSFGFLELCCLFLLLIPWPELGLYVGFEKFEEVFFVDFGSWVYEYESICGKSGFITFFDVGGKDECEAVFSVFDVASSCFRSHFGFLFGCFFRKSYVVL